VDFGHIKIISNEARDPGFEYAKEIEFFLRERGFSPEIVRTGEGVSSALFCVRMESEPGFERTGTPEDVPSVSAAGRARFVIVLGGDGTMLQAAHYAAVLDVPMLGINLGNLGFLTDADKFHGITALEKVLAGNFSREKRIMLEAEFGAGEIIPIEKRLALNEFYIGEMGRLTDCSVYVNEQFTATIRADGIIVSTPTGSTAYNLSAGGPILMPDGQMIAITPVCPHSLSARPWVIGADDTVRIVAKKTAHVIVDGETAGRIPAGESVLIKIAPFAATILRTAQPNFYATLRKKKLL